MENVKEHQTKEIPEISSLSLLSRQYLLAMGSVGHYIKQIEQYHESHQTDDPLPPRWLHLAERSLLHRPILKYLEYFKPEEFHHPHYNEEVLARIKALDELVDSFNNLLQTEGILRQLKAKESPEFQALRELYSKAKNIVTRGHAS